MKAILTALLCAMSLATPAGVYKCFVDGKTTFSQIPCGDQAEEIEVKTDAPSGPAVPIQQQYR